ncbi:MAG: hypothetical protein ACLR8P_04605 [Clostridium fessum]
MLEFLQTGKALSVLAAIGMIGFVSKLITRSLYKRLLKETDNMAMTRNKNLQNLKQRLENTCRCRTEHREHAGISGQAD